MKKYYVIFGPPGAGKGTQSYLLVEKFNLKHISTGDLLRREIAEKTELGILAKSIIDKGQFVDDNIVFEMIKKEIGNGSKGITGYILDGFPRTLDQAFALDSFLTSIGRKVDAVISLSVSEDVIIERIRHRAEIEDRADDTSIETIRTRIDTYHKKTEPLITYYIKKGIYHQIDGEAGIEENFKDICNIINKINNE